MENIQTVTPPRCLPGLSISRASTRYSQYVMEAHPDKAYYVVEWRYDFLKKGSCEAFVEADLLKAKNLYYYYTNLSFCRVAKLWKIGPVDPDTGRRPARELVEFAYRMNKRNSRERG